MTFEEEDPAIAAEMKQGEAAFDYDTFEETQTLKCILTPEEIREAGELMARAVGERNEAESTLKSIAAQYKARIANADATTSECAIKIRSGFEFRPVPVEVVHHYTRGEVIRTRKDTWEEIEVRPMNPQERQRSLFKKGGNE